MPPDGALRIALPFRPPFDGAGLLGFLASRAVPGVEEVRAGAFRRSLGLHHGPATIELEPGTDHVACMLRLADRRDAAEAVRSARRLLDLDADPAPIDAALGRDPLLGPLVARTPGRRVPGAAGGFELAVRAVVGQQISVAGARTIAGRLATAYGTPLPAPLAAGPLTHLFPDPEQLAAADPADLPMPRSRGRTLVALAAAMAAGSLVLDDGADRAGARVRLLALPGIGPWTADYVAMRALRDPDVFLPTDLGVRSALRRLGRPDDPRSAAELAERWRPWRSYGLLHLWSTLAASAAGAQSGDG